MYAIIWMDRRSHYPDYEVYTFTSIDKARKWVSKFLRENQTNEISLEDLFDEELEIEYDDERYLTLAPIYNKE